VCLHPLTDAGGSFVLALRFYRLKRHWTQKALAERVGTCQPTIAAFELGARKPNDAMLARLADALAVEPAFALLRPVEVRFPEPGESERA
jgi:transcriptional regulator with XRE-family HTH domain